MSPRSSTTTSEPANQQNEPLGLELKEERRSDPSFDETFTDDEAHTSGVSSCDEESICMSKKPKNTSEYISERLEQRGEENSPRQVPEDPDEQGSETAAPDEPHNHHGCTRGVRDECEVEIWGQKA